MKDRTHDDAMAELFREDPTFAARYLRNVMAERNQLDQLVALRQASLAFGNDQKPAK